MQSPLIDSVQPIVLEAEWHPASSLFRVSVTVQGALHRQEMEPDEYYGFCAELEHGIHMNTMILHYRSFNRRDITIRMQRGIREYFRSVLQLTK